MTNDLLSSLTHEYEKAEQFHPSFDGNIKIFFQDLISGIFKNEKLESQTNSTLPPDNL